MINVDVLNYLKNEINVPTISKIDQVKRNNLI